MDTLTAEEKDLLLTLVDTQFEVNKSYMRHYEVTPKLIDEQHMLNDIKTKLES